MAIINRKKLLDRTIALKNSLAVGQKRNANLDIASARISQGRGTTQDKANVGYAEKRYNYNSQPAKPVPAMATNPISRPATPTPAAPTLVATPAPAPVGAPQISKPIQAVANQVAMVKKRTSNLDIAAKRVAAGTATSTDKANLAYAKKRKLY